MECAHCHTEIQKGSCHMYHMNDSRTWHIGCFEAAMKGNPVTKLLCKVRCA